VLLTAPKLAIRCGEVKQTLKRKYLGLLSAGHFFTDVNQGALPAILPFLIAEHNLSYASAATLVLAANLVSSVIQPLIGHLADKKPMPWLMPAGVFCAGLGMATTGFIDSYWLLFLAVAVSGIGVAAFHPEAARLANFVSGEKKGTGLSIFGVGGNAGIAAGPVFTTAALLLWGLKGTLVLLVPVTLMAAFLTLALEPLRQFHPAPAKKGPAAGAAAAPDEWGAFARLTVVIFGRSTIFYGLTTFIPLYWINILHQSKAAGGTALSILLFTGAVGTLIGGRLADKYGYRQVVRAGFTALVPMMFLFLAAGDVAVATLLLIPLGFCLYIPFSPTIVLGQKYLPNRMGLASGVTIGLAVSIGGVTAPLLGWIADGYGLGATFAALAAVPVIAALAAFTLTQPGRAARPAVSAGKP
jgi:FSR family fosmidomycin resistance protein-like MFS transporter